MFRERSSDNNSGRSNRSDTYRVIIPIASRRKPRPSTGIHDLQLAKAVETQFNIILPDLPPVNISEPTDNQ